MKWFTLTQLLQLVFAAGHVVARQGYLQIERAQFVAEVLLVLVVGNTKLVAVVCFWECLWNAIKALLSSSTATNARSSPSGVETSLMLACVSNCGMISTM